MTDFNPKNPTHSLEEQPQLQAQVILASKHTDDGLPIFTVRMRYPRIIHSEIMTHRVFGRNARSSRAVPFKTMLRELMTTPFVPWHWGKNQSGMQADEENSTPVPIGEYFPNDSLVTAGPHAAWLKARDNAVKVAQAFADADYHKQNVNRLIEPFAWMDMLVTSTQWKNFFWLRQHGAAEPHLQDLANVVFKAVTHASFERLQNGWHLPYITQEEAMKYPLDIQQKLSAARCARISYVPFDGKPNVEREIERYDMLVKSDRVHASPLEHQATPDKRVICPTTGQAERWENPHLHGNLTDWIQYRKIVPNEAMMDG